MDSETVIKVEGLYKKFTTSLKRSMLYGSSDISKSMLGINFDSGKLRKGEFWALENLTFELKKGDALGIIGENGSGKSTLLRLLTGIFPPDKGKIELKGRIGSLIAVGAGFHPYMTGRENIYLNGVILGMSRKEIEAKFDDIIEFADIGRFIDAPVSTYSSGMRVRLGFAIAIHSQPDILLIDEILSVGDLSFRNKSLRHMAEFKQKANALIFVSHDLEQIRNLCNRVIVMDKGEVVFDGKTSEGLVYYQNLTKDERIKSLQVDLKEELVGQTDTDDVEFIRNGIMTLDEKIVDSIPYKSGFIHFIDFKLKHSNKKLYFSSGIFDEKYNQVIWKISNEVDPDLHTYLDEGSYRAKFVYTKPNLMPGVYTLTFGIRNADTFETYQRFTRAGNFKIVSDNEFERGVVDAECKVDIVKL